MSAANETQVGGDHYRTEYQHWDLATDLNLGYFEGQITKYVTRWRSKNGLQDLEKARHFTAKLIEGLHAGKLHPPVYDTLGMSLTLYRYNRANRLWMAEEDIVRMVCTWSSATDLEKIDVMIGGMILYSKDRNENAIQHERDPQSSARGARSPSRAQSNADYDDAWAKQNAQGEYEISRWFEAQNTRHNFASVGWLRLSPDLRIQWRRAWGGRNLPGATDPRNCAANDPKPSSEKSPSTEDGAPGKAYVDQ